ncbi:hypothetical protein BBD39_09135 [Arsenophonus endosymbiont of Bemisia tabaci Asia II 3]|nr:hypothetical protein BBD39_09135 [Arsenophonus endosymbiont of Bemisia tabaci Asia II 3]
MRYLKNGTSIIARQTKPLSVKEIEVTKPKESDYVLNDYLIWWSGIFNKKTRSAIAAQKINSEQEYQSYLYQMKSQTLRY